MWVDDYKKAVHHQIDELLNTLSPEQIDALRNQCRGLGRKGWIRWFDENRQDVIFFLIATPQERRMKESWQSSDRKGLLVLSSLWHAYQGLSLLDEMEDQGFGKDTERTAAASVGEAALGVTLRDIPDWPFSGPSPFE